MDARTTASLQMAADMLDEYMSADPAEVLVALALAAGAVVTLPRIGRNCATIS